MYCCLKNGRIVAGMPGVVKDFKLVKILYSSIPYGGLIGEEKYFPRFMEEMKKLQGIAQFRMIPSPGMDYPFQAKRIDTICTLIDLQNMNEERLFARYNHYLRRDIRRADRYGIKIRKATSIDDLSAFYAMYLNSMERNRAVAKYSFEWVEAVSSKGVILFAEMRDIVVAGILLVHSGKTTHAMIAGSDSRYLKFFPNKLLIHHALLEAVSCESGTFDFGGSSPDDRELIRFKEQFGGKSIKLTTYIIDLEPLKCWLWEKGRRIMSTGIGANILRKVRGRPVLENSVFMR